MRLSYTKLVKGMLPDAITATERGTFLYQLDGEREAWPTYSAAARALGKALELGKRHVPTEEIERRVGVKPVYTNVEAFGSNPKIAKATVIVPKQATPDVRSPRATKQRRSISVHLPQSVLTELLRGGRAKVLLRVDR